MTVHVNGNESHISNHSTNNYEIKKMSNVTSPSFDEILPMAIRFLSGISNHKYGGSIKMNSNSQLSSLLEKKYNHIKNPRESNVKLSKYASGKKSSHRDSVVNDLILN